MGRWWLEDIKEGIRPFRGDTRHIPCCTCVRHWTLGSRSVRSFGSSTHLPRLYVELLLVAYLEIARRRPSVVVCGETLLGAPCALLVRSRNQMCWPVVRTFVLLGSTYVRKRGREAGRQGAAHMLGS